MHPYRPTTLQLMELGTHGYMPDITEVLFISLSSAKLLYCKYLVIGKENFEINQVPCAMCNVLYIMWFAISASPALWLLSFLRSS